MSQSLKHLPEVVSYIKRLERRLDGIAMAINTMQRVELKVPSVARAFGYAESRSTLAVERHGHADWLVATDGNGQNELLAVFVGDEQVDMFTRALALAKASVHAMGQSGI